ncbi:MAG: DNA primase, partial [Planctomycetes bacterium]|nr:DNA primase [Planctomycetota bacterium]
RARDFWRAFGQRAFEQQQHRADFTPRDPLKDWDALKEDIRQRIDLVEIVSEHVALKRAGKDFVGLCPFHQEKSPSFSVSPTKQIFKCFGCGVGGDLFSFVQQREAVNFVEAMRILADRAGVDLDRDSGRSGGGGFAGGKNAGAAGGGKVGGGGQTGPDRSDLARANAWAMGEFQAALSDEKLGETARLYLRERGLNNDMVEKFGLGWAPENGSWLPDRARKTGFDLRALMAADVIRRSDRGSEYGVFRGRLMFPIRDTMNRVIGFGGRTLIGDRAKYLNTSHTSLYDKSLQLYGIDQARRPMSDKRQAIVVEGYTDCLAAHQFGLTNTVATLGTALTEQQIALLRRWCDEVVLLFDSDSAGEEAADRALGVALRHNLSVRVAAVPDGKDPCDYLMAHGADGVDPLLNGAVDALRFKWVRTCEQFANAKGGGQRQAIETFIALVAEMSRYGSLDAIQRGLVINQVSGLLAVAPVDVVKFLSAAQQKAEVQFSRRADRQSARPVADTRAAPPLPDAKQAALRGMLQVLVNEPGFYGDVSDVFEPSMFQDASHRRVAVEVAALCEALGEFQISELMNRLHDNPSAVSLVSDLVYDGERKGQYQAVIHDTRDRLLRLTPCNDSTEEKVDETQRLQQIHKSLSQRRGFAPGVPTSVAPTANVPVSTPIGAAKDNH